MKSRACHRLAFAFIALGVYYVSSRIPLLGSDRLHQAHHGPTPITGGHASRAPLRNASIVICITSKMESYDRRSWMRERLAHSLSLLATTHPRLAEQAVFVFVIGTHAVDGEALAGIKAEQSQHGDILILPDTRDADNPDPPAAGVDSVTCIKVLRAAEWAVKNFRFPFLVRLGDDAFFRVDYFLQSVADTLPRSHLLLGFCPPDMKHAFTHPYDTQVRYCSGMGFVLTHDAATYLAENRNILRKPWPEDAAVALWLAGTQIQIVHDERFQDWEWKKCSNHSIIVHKHKYNSVNDLGVMTNCFPEI